VVLNGLQPLSLDKGIVMRKYKYKIDRNLLNKTLSFELQDKLQKEKVLLMPYFHFEESKNIFLKTMKIIFEDCNSGKTMFKAKPGEFKTDSQKEGNGDLNIFDKEGFTVNEYRSGSNNFDFFFIQMLPAFHDKDMFEVLYRFYEVNFDKLKFNYLKNC